MNERPTPETDVLDRVVRNPKVLSDRYIIMREHSCRMERERDEAREVLKTIASWQGGLGAKWPMEIARDFLEAAK